MRPLSAFSSFFSCLGRLGSFGSAGVMDSASTCLFAGSRRRHCAVGAGSPLPLLCSSLPSCPRLDCAYSISENLHFCVFRHINFLLGHMQPAIKCALKNLSELNLYLLYFSLVFSVFRCSLPSHHDNHLMTMSRVLPLTAVWVISGSVTFD